MQDNLKRIQQKFNKIAKILYSLPKSTPNETIRKIMGNWNMKTLAIMSYSRSAKIWLKQKENTQQQKIKTKL